MSFTKTKDRVFRAYDTFAAWLARRPKSVRNIAYAVIGSTLRLFYFLPGNPVGQTAVALSAHIGLRSPRRLYRDYVRQLLLAFERAERIRHGFGEEIDETLTIPDQERFDALVEKGGFILTLPHAHCAIPMVRNLSRAYPLLSIARLSKDKNRASAQRDLYEKVGCEFVDIRETDPVAVARTVIKTLKQGKIVFAMVDRIYEPPAQPIGETPDLATVTAFGENVGVQTWPARFARKVGVPILPATVIQTDEEMQLILGKDIEPTDDLVSTSQEWMSELELLFRLHPQEWMFWLDKHWSRVLRRNPPRNDPARSLSEGDSRKIVSEQTPSS